MLVGFPTKEYQLNKNNENNEIEETWVTDDILSSYVAVGWFPTGNHRMGYATPAWLPKTENPKGGLLLLDDFNRKIIHNFLTK